MIREQVYKLNPTVFVFLYKLQIHVYLKISKFFKPMIKTVRFTKTVMELILLRVDLLTHEEHPIGSIRPNSLHGSSVNPSRWKK